ncbi:MAG: ABC transporter ATP-binding protein [Bacilli bacterium]|nr:ABC transporter ATP-binding protein [Bacilli bacterium]
MLKLFKNLTKREVVFMIISSLFIIFQVALELKMPDYMSQITVLVQTEGASFKDILTNGAYMMLCALGSLLSAVVAGYLIAEITSKFSLNTRSKLYKKIIYLDTDKTKEFKISSLITRTTNDITQVENLLGFGMQMLIKAPLTAAWAITKILNKNIEWSIATIIAVLILIFTLLNIMLRVLPRFKIVQSLIDKLNGVERENLQGIRVVRAFNAEKYSEDKFDKVNNDLTFNQLKNQKLFAILSPVMYLVMNGLSLSIYIIGAILISNSLLIDKLTLFSNMVVFYSYAMQVIMSFLMLVMVFMMLPRAEVSAKRINEVLDVEDKIIEGNIIKGSEVGTVEFKNVSFKYPDAEEYVLENISFKANKGETIAFIGSTGSGKSTLINLIPRFYDVTSGEILVDGINVKDYQKEILNNIIGYVSQKAVIFSGTVKSNIKFGKSNNKISEKDILDAAKIAEAKEFVEKMEDTYNSHISQGGTNISGGQKQRLSIARAVAKDPEIYIFDDSFSALDYKTDAVLRHNLKKNKKDATMLIVAQRIGTIMNADKIMVLDNGKCVGIGTHKELLKNCEVYKEIALSQLSKEELENA